MSKLIPKLLVVSFVQALMAWFFYRCRVRSHSHWTDSDFIVFGVPLLAGFAAFALILFRSAFAKRSSSKRGVIIFGISAGGALLSSFVGAIVGFNLYGT